MASAVEKTNSCSTESGPRAEIRTRMELAAAAIHLEQFARAAEELVVEQAERGNRAVPGAAARIGSENEWPPGAARKWPGHLAPPWAIAARRNSPCHPLISLRSKLVWPNKLRRVRCCGMRVDLAGRGDLLQRAVAQQRDTVGERHGFFLVVSDKQKGNAELRAARLFNSLCICLRRLASSAESGSSSKEKQRAIDECAGKSDALLLAAAPIWTVGNLRTPAFFTMQQCFLDTVCRFPLQRFS